VTYNEPTWIHLFDGDSTSVDLSRSIGYWGGHFDFLDGGAYKRKHAAAFDFNNNVAQNWDPEFDTSEGIFTVEVVPERMVIYGGNFSGQPSPAARYRRLPPRGRRPALIVSTRSAPTPF